ncbi:MAG TPA: histidine kinase N-terminal 7TM domain-containing protein [Bacillota bacterium]|nr:histidine kinase N-terminal 7TM domain-containing protein [Bacillota bacterium]
MVDNNLVNFYHPIYWNIDINMVASFIGALSSLGFILMAWVKRKRTPLLYWFLAMQILFFSQYTNNLLLSFPVHWDKNWLFTLIDYWFYSFIGPVSLAFILVFCEHQLSTDKKCLYRLFIPPAVIYLLLLTDPFHHLFFKIEDFPRRVYGPIFWLNYLMTFLYLTAGIYYLVKYSLQKKSHFIKKQALTIILGILTGILTALIYTLRIWKYAWPVACFGMVITVFLIVIASYYRFFKITPLALRRLTENIKESIVVIDIFNEINNFNNHFRDHFLTGIDIQKSNHIEIWARELENAVIASIESQLILNAIRDPVKEPVTGELTVTKPKQRTYMVHVQPVFMKQDLIGRVVSFNDISDYKGLLEDYDNKNSQLMTLNQELTAMNDELMTASERLHEYAATVEELSIANERNRLARDVHDILGHTMTLVLTSLEVSQLSCDKDLEITKKYLAEAADITRKGITELRNSIRGMVPERVNTNNLIKMLKKLIADFQISGMSIDFSYSEPEMFLEPVHSDVIYRICQEALTNSFRHGKAHEVSIIFRVDPDRIKLFIFDNGCGCKEVQPGYGLTGMRQRVLDLRGNITFGSDGERGFTIHVEIPTKSV